MPKSALADEAKSTTEKLLDLLEVKDAVVEAVEEEDVITIQIQVPDEASGQLIGYHGDTLNAFQYLVGQIVNKGKDHWARIIVNINSYRSQREAELRQMAKNAADRALATGDEIEMPYLTSFERRIIHLELADRSDITTYSEGEEQNRRLIITPKKQLDQ